MKRLLVLGAIFVSFSLIPHQCLGLQIVSPDKIVNLFLGPGESTVLQITLRGENGDGKIVASEAIFSMNNGKIESYNDPLKAKFIDPNFLNGAFLLNDGEETTYDVSISVDVNTKPGSYPRVLVFTPEKGNIVGSTRHIRYEACIIYVNVIGSPIRNVVIDAKFLPSSENKKIFISGSVFNGGNFYVRIKDAIFSLETTHGVLEKSTLNIYKAQDGEIYVLPGETQIFHGGEITVPLLARDDYVVKINFFCKDINGQTKELKFDKGEISKEFKLPISPELSKTVWGPLPHFDLDPSEEEKEVYVLKEGNGMYQTWEVKNRTSKPLTIQVSASPKEWDVIFPAKFEIAPDDSYEFDAKLLNPKGIQKLKCELIFQAMDPKGGMVGKIAKKIIQRGDGE